VPAENPSAAGPCILRRVWASRSNFKNSTRKWNAYSLTPDLLDLYLQMEHCQNFAVGQSSVCSQDQLQDCFRDSGWDLSPPILVGLTLADDRYMKYFTGVAITSIGTSDFRALHSKLADHS
jgi:hypothetical protein